MRRTKEQGGGKAKGTARRRVKKALCVLAVLLLAAGLGFILTGYSIWQYGQRDEKRKADAAVILGAGSWKGEVSPVFRERLNHGIWLYQNGYVRKLILTGGYAEGNDESDAHAAMLYVTAQGVPQSDILLEEKSKVTRENLEYAKKVMDANGLKDAVLVSDPLHMKRAMRMAKDVGMTAYSSPTPTTRYVSLKTRIPFLEKEDLYYISYCAACFLRIPWSGLNRAYAKLTSMSSICARLASR